MAPRKRKQAEQAEVVTSTVAERRWKASFETERGFKAERHIYRDDPSWPANFRAFVALDNQGMKYWYKRNPGYNKAIVTEFYKNMTVPESVLAPGARIISSIGKTAVFIDANKVAFHMGYARPDGGCTFPPPADNPITPDHVRQEIYTNPQEYSTPHKPGKFTQPYRLLNHIVCFNLYPRGGENKPSAYVGQILYALGQPETICDWALFMFAEMVAVKATNRGRLPFPCLLTRIFQAEGINRGNYAVFEKPHPGTIGDDFLTRSLGQIRQVPSLRSPPPKEASIKSWLKKIFYQNVAIMTSLTKGKSERRQLSRRMDHVEHRLSYVSQRGDPGASSSYVPPELPDLEVSDDFAGHWEASDQSSDASGDAADGGDSDGDDA